MTWSARVLVLAIALALSTAALGQVCDGISPASGTNLTTIRVASGLTRPILAISPPGDPSRLFIVEQTGLIKILQNGVVGGTEFIDVSSLIRAPGGGGGNDEEGLLGLAFHPDYQTNGWFFLYYTNLAGNNEVRRFTRSTPDTAPLASAMPVPAITIPHPGWSNHNGGMIAFGPNDGYLYIAPGDGGGSCDSTGSAQDDSRLRGKMLRIDVDALPYTIPGTNPYDGPGDPLDEIWSIGLRNPWRFSFDSASGDLYIGDVGQGAWEEINYRPASSTGEENYGWVNCEGTACPSGCPGSGPAPPGHVPPVLVFSSSGSGGGACAVTGGYVYRGCRIPDLHGRYFYGDYCAAFIRSFVIQAGIAKDPLDHTTELAPGGGLSIGELTAFGQDGRGELYIMDRGVFSGGNGEVFQIVPVLESMEVSGINAVPFVVGPSFDWEDLTATSPHPITGYQVYRHVGDGSGTFDCVHQSAGNLWIGGDPADPLNPSELFSYVITAENAAGDQTSPGSSSSGVERALSNSPCP